MITRCIGAAPHGDVLDLLIAWVDSEPDDIGRDGFRHGAVGTRHHGGPQAHGGPYRVRARRWLRGRAQFAAVGHEDDVQVAALGLPIVFRGGIEAAEGTLEILLGGLQGARQGGVAPTAQFLSWGGAGVVDQCQDRGGVVGADLFAQPRRVGVGRAHVAAHVVGAQATPVLRELHEPELGVARGLQHPVEGALGVADLFCIAKALVLGGADHVLVHRTGGVEHDQKVRLDLGAGPCGHPKGGAQQTACDRQRVSKIWSHGTGPPT